VVFAWLFWLKAESTRHTKHEAKPPLLDIQLTPWEESTRENLVVDVQVTNHCSQPIAWDEEFSLLLRWRLRPLDDPKYSESARRVLGPKGHDTVVKQTRESKSKNRFLSIPAGGTVVHRFVLTAPFRAFLPLGHDTDFGAREVLHQFIIPKECRSLEIYLQYDALPGWTDGFKELFGFEPRDVNLPGGLWTSNSVTVAFPD